MNTDSSFALDLFYSYSHKDAGYKHGMETALSLLQTEGYIDQWSDEEILPGQNLTPEIQEKMDRADIMVFLFSLDFIASRACTDEWEYGQKLNSQGKMLFRIPIILRPCPWIDVLDGDDVKALPRDGKPVSTYDDADVAWLEVYEGIKNVVEHVRKTLSPKPKFVSKMEDTEFLSQHSIKLQDIFVFPNLILQDPGQANKVQQNFVSTQDDLLKIKRAIIHGPEKCGKTALARYLYLSLISEAEPVLLMDLEEVGKSAREIRFREAFDEQFLGEYQTWRSYGNRTLILDNMTATPRHIQMAQLADRHFDRIIIFLSSDVFRSFFWDEPRLAKYQELLISTLTYTQQETLIRKRLSLRSNGEALTDGSVDHAEDRVNSIIISRRILPRYPFYVLSILQTYEGFMPTNLNITSYGHCYYALIVSSLIRSGVSDSDDEMNACFNFTTHLAHALYKHDTSSQSKQSFSFEKFVEHYTEQFHINVSTINRLRSEAFGVLDSAGRFRSRYMYYYFLGQYLAENKTTSMQILEDICATSYINANHLTILFTVHHTHDSDIIDRIRFATQGTLGSVPPAILDSNETKGFEALVAAIPDNILSADSVAKARWEERNLRSELEESQEVDDDLEESMEEAHPVNDVYLILKNNKIMGQILRNSYGILQKSKVQEIIETVADAGLRLINIALADEEVIEDYAYLLHEKYPEWDLDKIKETLQWLSLLSTVIILRDIDGAIGVPEIRESVDLVVNREDTPAYDVLGYFNRLTIAEELAVSDRDALSELYERHEDPFIRWVLSIRTQQYMNTHRSRTMIEQQICSVLGI